MRLPVIRVFQWDTTEPASPAGSRTVPGGSFAFRRIVSSGCSTSDPQNPATTSGILNFNGLKFNLANDPVSELASVPSAITFNLANSGVAISEMRLYLADKSALLGSKDVGLPEAIIQYAPSGNNWRFNLRMPSGIFSQIPEVVPTEPNIFRQDKTSALAGQDDLNSSEFIYINVVLPNGFPLGSYGVCGSGILRLGLIYNYWNNDFLLNFGN